MEQFVIPVAQGVRLEVTHISPEDQARHALWLDSAERLGQLAQRALDRKLAPKDCMLVCIDVDDAAWRPLVDILMPDNEPQWAALRAQGMRPIARGTVMREELQESLVKLCPAMRTAFKHPVSKKSMLCLVLGAGGFSAYLVAPKAA